MAILFLRESHCHQFGKNCKSWKKATPLKSESSRELSLVTPFDRRSGAILGFAASAVGVPRCEPNSTRGPQLNRFQGRAGKLMCGVLGLDTIQAEG